MMKLFAKIVNSFQRFLTVTIFTRKAPSQLFDGFLNTHPQYPFLHKLTSWKQNIRNAASTFFPSLLFCIFCLLSLKFNLSEKGKAIKKKTNFMAPFSGRGSTASRLERLRGGSLLFTTNNNTNNNDIEKTQVKVQLTL